MTVLLLLLLLLLAAVGCRCQVFVNAVSAVRRLAALLQLLQLPATALHAQQQQRQRLKALDRFKSHPHGVLVATDVAARGLDIPDVQVRAQVSGGRGGGESAVIGSGGSCCCCCCNCPGQSMLLRWAALLVLCVLVFVSLIEKMQSAARSCSTLSRHMA